MWSNLKEHWKAMRNLTQLRASKNGVAIQKNETKSKCEQHRCVVISRSAMRAPRPGIRRGLRDHKGHDHDTERHPDGNACWVANMHRGCGQPRPAKHSQQQPGADQGN